jgi:hypothetical protein
MRVSLTAQSKTRLAALRIRQLFLYRALIETAFWQESTPISQNRDWFEWMARETLDLEPCSKSQTARSVAARLGHDRQPGTPMHVFLCCHSKTAIFFILVHSAIDFRYCLLFILISSLLPTIAFDCIVHTNFVAIQTLRAINIH